MKNIHLPLLFICFICVTSFDLKKKNTVSEIKDLYLIANINSGLNDELTDALKDALNIGIKNAVNVLSKENGFFKDPLVKIPFPDEVKFVEDKLRRVGMGRMVDDFILKMNRGAEKAVIKATPIFMTAIKSMNFKDALEILKGKDNAATMYLKETTTEALYDAFSPEVNAVLNQTGVARNWEKITTAYNKIPFTKDVESDLTKYVTNKALNGLFIKMAYEEKLIREKPAARVTEILKRVFGLLDR
ncbi:DUF4197 domain-containing protein [Bacteroidota bacterium]